MKKILVLGAGRSAYALIDYLLRHAESGGYIVTVADADLEAARQKIGDHVAGNPVQLNVAEIAERRALIAAHDLCISLLPPHLHLWAARDCVQIGRHLLTASYVSPDMQALDAEARAQGVMLMNELGLDPGIDHMSAMQRLRQIKTNGGRITGFYSSTGGLVAPASDDNPWHYKFSWNPRNVVLAGQSMAQFKEQGRLRFIPYSRLFRQTRPVEIPGKGRWEAYANRDSLTYIQAYGIEDADTVFRGTIRHEGFCAAWDAVIRLGLTNPDWQVPDLRYYDWAGLTEALLGPAGIPGYTLRDKAAIVLGESPDSAVMERLAWLGIFDPKPIGLAQGSPVDALQNLLLEKWGMRPEDRDMILMQHVIEYEREGRAHTLRSTLALEGIDARHTAMTITVGLPLGILARHLLAGSVAPTPGVHIPLASEVYEPILSELEQYGVRFTEEEWMADSDFRRRM